MAVIEFWHWLKAQADRADPVGDLARDAATDPSFPWSEGDAAIRRYVQALGSQAAQDAMVEALVQWNRWTAPRQTEG